MAAYVAAAHNLAPSVSILDLAAASAVVMLAASLPISLAGWGVRELSAVLALGIVGVPSDAALVVAILVEQHLCVVVGVFALSWFWSTNLPPHTTPSRIETPIDYGAVLSWGIPILAATAVHFQLWIPVGKGELNINLADPLALLGRAFFDLGGAGTPLAGVAPFLVQRSHYCHHCRTFICTPSRRDCFWLDIMGCHQPFLGWFVLLGYAATGAMIVRCGTCKG